VKRKNFIQLSLKKKKKKSEKKGPILPIVWGGEGETSVKKARDDEGGIFFQRGGKGGKGERGKWVESHITN